MERLSGIEAVSLHTETSKTPAHTVAVIMLAVLTPLGAGADSRTRFGRHGRRAAG